MAKVAYIQTNLSGGEFSPQVAGRVDIAKYANGVNTLENTLVKSYGGAYKRPGTYYVTEVKDSAKATRLVSFQFSVTQAYILEFGDLYVRFYKDGGQITSGGVAVEVATPYVEDDLFDLQFAQSADVLYIAHKNYAPRKLSRTSHTAWTLTQIDFKWGPFLTENDTATTITPSGTSGSINLVASADTFQDTGLYGDLAGHVGSIWKIGTGYVKITSVTNAQLAVASVIIAVTADAHTDWSEGAWSDYRGYPGSVTFYEQRLWWGGSHHKPQSMWASQTDDYENMETGADAADALAYTISDNQVNAISWMLPVRQLAIGSVGGTFVLDTGEDPVTPTNIAIRKEMSYRSARLVPLRIGNLIYYLQSNEKTVREIGYDYSTDTFVGNDITLLAEHITGAGIVDWACQESPDNVIWCVRSDGQIACLTRQIEQQVVAWTRLTTDGDFKSVAIIPNGAEDQVWVVVERVVDGNTKKYIEYFKPFNFGTEQEDCFFVDCGLTLDSPLTITGITRANPCVVTSATHGLSNGDRVRLRNIVGMTELNRRYFLVADKTDHTFELTDLAGDDIDSTLYSDYVSGGEIRKCVASVSGLDHLEGESVKVLVDGGTHPDCVVATGAITLNGYYSEIHAGMRYSPRILTLRPETGSSMGTAQGMTKKIYKAIVRLFESLGVKLGNETTQETIAFRAISDPLNKAPDLFTGDKEISFPANYDKDGRILITQDDPLPLTILAIIYKLYISDE